MKERISPEICTEPPSDERAGPLEDERRVSLGHLGEQDRSQGPLHCSLLNVCGIFHGEKFRCRSHRQQQHTKGY